MTAILIDMYECDIAHEASLLEEYSMEASWMPRFLRSKQPARVTPPLISKLSDMAEDIDDIGIVHAEALPTCP